MAGWSALHKRFGKKDFSTLFDNAIDYANNGFPVSEVVAYYLDISSSRFKDYPNFSDVWMPNNKSLQKGDIFKNRDLANTYLSIAESYGSSFYSGTLAKSMTEFIQEQGGLPYNQ